MTVLEESEDEQPSHLRLAVNNDSGPPLGGEDWLSKLDNGTIFLCQHKTQGNISEIEILAKSPKGLVKLFNRLENNVQWFLTNRYCFFYDHLDTLE